MNPPHKRGWLKLIVVAELSLFFKASLAEEKNNMEPDISYSCKSESGEESKQTILALGFSI